MEIATKALLDELDAAGVAYVRVNTADPHDSLSGRGTWSLHNALEALVHIAAAMRICITSRDVRAVYIPVSQELPGLLRDLAFFVVAIASRKPFAVHLHGGNFCEYLSARNSPFQRIVKALMGRAALGIVLTERLRPALSCAIDDRRIIVVPNGVDLPTTPRRPRGQSDTDEVRLLFLSSLLPSKGSFVFLEAFALVRQSRENVVATVAGTWPSSEVRDETLKHAVELGISDHVRFEGAVFGTAKTDVFLTADIFCLPSFYPLEGQPLVVLEAMAAELPVVATAWRGIADTVVDGVTGFLVPSPDPTMISERIVTLVDDPELRGRMGSKSRARYEAEFTQRAFGARMLEAFKPWTSSNAGPSDETES